MMKPAANYRLVLEEVLPPALAAGQGAELGPEEEESALAAEGASVPAAAELALALAEELGPEVVAVAEAVAEEALPVLVPAAGAVPELAVEEEAAVAEASEKGKPGAEQQQLSGCWKEEAPHLH